MKIITWNFHRGQIFVRHGFTQSNVVVYTAEKELEPLETNTHTEKVTAKQMNWRIFLPTPRKERRKLSDTFILNARRWLIYRYAAGCEKTSFAKKQKWCLKTHLSCFVYPLGALLLIALMGRKLQSSRDGRSLRDVGLFLKNETGSGNESKLMERPPPCFRRCSGRMLQRERWKVS